VSRKVYETRICDACGKEMPKDGPIWYGGELTVHENYATMDRYTSDTFTVDMCRECLKKVRAMVKHEGYGDPLPKEMADAVDKAAASIERAIRRTGSVWG